MAIVVPANAHQRHFHIAGGGNIPEGIADVDDAVDVVVLGVDIVEDGLDDVFAGEFLVSAMKEDGLVGNAHVFQFNLGGFAPASGSDAYQEAVIIEEIAHCAVGTGYHTEFMGMQGPFLPDPIHECIVKLLEFGLGVGSFEVLFDDRFEDGRIRNVGVLGPVDARERALVDGLVGFGEALAVHFIGIDQGAVYIEDY